MNTGQAVGVAEKPTHGVERASRLISGVVELTGFSQRTVYNWIAAREVEGFRSPNGSYRIYLDSLKPKHMSRVRG